MAYIDVAETGAEVFNAFSRLALYFSADRENLWTDDGSVPSAPDSSKFMAHKSGKISVKMNPTIYNYGMAEHYHFALTVGCNIPNHVEILNEFWNQLLNEMQLPPGMLKGEIGAAFKGSDGHTVCIVKHYGTAYIGIYVRYA